MEGRRAGLRLLEVTRVDLVRRVRNRSAPIAAFVAPLALALLLGFILEGLFSTTFTVGIVDEEGSAGSALVVDAVEQNVRDLGSETGTDVTSGGSVSVRRIDSREEASAMVHDGDVSAAIVIPEGYTDSSSDLVVLQSPRRAVGGQVGLALASAITEQVYRFQVTAEVLDATGGELTPALAGEIQERPNPLVVQEDREEGIVSPEAFFGASMCILFLFFTVGFAPRSVLIDREQGIMARVLSTPVSVGTVIAGKSLSVALLGVVGFVGVWVVTTVAFGAGWGHPLGVTILILATVAAIGGVSMFISSLGRTEKQADSFTTMATFVFALLGGNFIALGSAPPLLRRLALFTPNGWALRGFTDLSSGESVGAIVLPVVVLLAVTVATGAVGVVRLRATVSR